MAYSKIAIIEDLDIILNNLADLYREILVNSQMQVHDLSRQSIMSWIAYTLNKPVR